MTSNILTDIDLLITELNYKRNNVKTEKDIKDFLEVTCHRLKFQIEKILNSVYQNYFNEFALLEIKFEKLFDLFIQYETELKLINGNWKELFEFYEEVRIDLMQEKHSIQRKSKNTSENQYNKLIGIMKLKESHQNSNYTEVEKYSESNIQKADVKTPQKWYALLYWLTLKSKNKDYPTSFDGDLIRTEIEEIGKEYTKRATAQQFYVDFRALKLNCTSIEKEKKYIIDTFKKGWENKIIKLSKNDPFLSDYLKENFNP